MTSNDNILERFQATMILHAVGDAMGYKNGKWEFKFSTEDIHEELKALGGIDALVLEPKNWRVSDDTVLHLANAECLIAVGKVPPSPEVYLKLVEYYKIGMRDMDGRAPGNTTMSSVSKLSQRPPNGYQIPFNSKGGGCGASMRSSCIGLRFCKPDQVQELVEFAIESGRMSHHHPIGYLGAVAAGLLTSYAIQGIKINNWGVKCLNDLELAKKYIIKAQVFKDENLEEWPKFTEMWKDFLKQRNIEVENSEPVFPDVYDVKETDKFYKHLSNGRWPGSNGLDSVLIAYDALLASKNDWKTLCMRAMLHGGDNDSTGCIAGSWYGAINGFQGVHENNFKSIEYKERLTKCANKLYELEFA